MVLREAEAIAEGGSVGGSEGIRPARPASCLM